MCEVGREKLTPVNSDGVLSNKSGELIVKPCKQSEIDFYESTSLHPDFAYYIPTYFGSLYLDDSKPVQAAGAIVLPAETSPDLPSPVTFGGETVTLEDEWTPSGGSKIQTDLAIVLENVAFDFKKPNILDVKLGARLWADDAPPAKRAKLDKAAEETTSQRLGFRIAGSKAYQYYKTDENDSLTPDGYKIYNKGYGRAFTPETIRKGFEDYFLLEPGAKARSGLRKVVRRFIDDLQGMVDAIEAEESRMYSASLLFVYEGDKDILEEAFTKEKEVLAVRKLRQDSHGDGDLHGNGEGFHAGDHISNDEEDEEDDEIKFPAIQSLKLIDFAHAQWTSGLGSDENILHGIKNVSKLLAEIAG